MILVSGARPETLRKIWYGGLRNWSWTKYNGNRISA
jgi:hypothetical protein